jgi:TolB protein
VNTISVSGRPTAESSEVDIVIDAFDPGWVYTRIADPGKGMLKILKVLRNDGMEVDNNNFWISREFDDSYTETNTFHLLDYRANASVTGKYKLIYEPTTEDLVPPVSSLQFVGPRVFADRVYLTPGTNIVFLATDNDAGSGVQQILRKVVGGDTDFVPAYPFNISAPGDAELEYFSVDRAGNQEPINAAYLYVDDEAPLVSTYEAVPESFAPHAPRGVMSDKETVLHIAAVDAVPTLNATVEIASGESFDPDGVVRTFDIELDSGAESAVEWDGRNSDGVLVASGLYTARLTVTDGLDWETSTHTTTVDIPVEIAEWFKGEPVDANLGAEQKYPDVSGGVVVWQDQRGGNWDIYLRDVADNGVAMALTDESADQIHPSIDGTMVVWQDRRGGNWDIYGYDLASEVEKIIRTAPGNQERPVVSDEWVAWQDDSAGNWDIFAYNLSTHELVQVTSHERDQMNPSISGNVLAWEDYRHGLGEIYTYDLETRTEARQTFNIYTQTDPSVSGDTLVWTDRRNEQRDIYYLNADTAETRITYGVGDHALASASGALVVYTDYEAGLGNPNLSFYHITTGIGAQLTSNPASQEEPSTDAPWVVWQDNRDGVHQVYWGKLNIEELPLEVELEPGFNLIAVGAGMAETYGTSSGLISGGLGIEKVVTQNSLNGIYLESSNDVDISLYKGMGIGVYATRATSIAVARSGETADYTLLPGLNYVGLLTVRPGYTAYKLLRSVGTANIQSVQRYVTKTGSWETAVVKDGTGVPELVGPDFTIHAGEGLVITMKNRVDGWRP